MTIASMNAGPINLPLPDILTLLAMISCCLFVIAGLEYAKANAFIEIEEEELADKTFVQAEIIASTGLISFIIAIPFIILALSPVSLSLSIFLPTSFNLSFSLPIGTQFISSVLRIFLTILFILLCMSNRDQSLFPQDWDTLTPIRHRMTRKHPYFQEWLDKCDGRKYQRRLEAGLESLSGDNIAEKRCRLEAWKVFLEEARMILKNRKITLSSFGDEDSDVNGEWEEEKYIPLNRREQEQEHGEEEEEEKLEEGLFRRQRTNCSCSSSR